MITKIKPCKWCGGTNHLSFQCRDNPKNANRQPIRAKKPMKKVGKVTKTWLKVREQWFKDHPAEWYNCSLRLVAECPGATRRSETTLDHIIPRSARPDLRYEYSNLQPACYPCNNEKSSTH